MLEKLLSNFGRYAPQIQKTAKWMIDYFIHHPKALEQALKGSIDVSTSVYKHIHRQMNKRASTLKLNVIILGKPGSGKKTLLRYIGGKTETYFVPGFSSTTLMDIADGELISDIVNDKSFDELVAKQRTIRQADAIIYLVSHLSISKYIDRDTLEPGVSEDLEHLAYWLEKDAKEEQTIIIVITFCDLINGYSVTDFSNNILITDQLASSPQVQEMLNIMGRKRAKVVCGSLVNHKTAYHLTANIEKYLIESAINI